MVVECPRPCTSLLIGMSVLYHEPRAMYHCLLWRKNLTEEEEQVDIQKWSTAVSG